jgi:hypothetical protein
MKYLLVIGAALWIGTLQTPVELMGAQDPILSGDAAITGRNDSSDQNARKKDVSVQPYVAAPLQPGSSTIFRDIPSISGRYSVGGKAIMPYVGAGFGGGYASDFDQSLVAPVPMQTNPGSRSQFGQVSTPNEFQMGLRIPF